MDKIKQIENLSEIQEEEYWKLVERVIREVLNRECTSSLHSKKENISKLPGDQKILFYHNDPLSVALSIANEKKELPNLEEEKREEEIIHKYITLRDEVYKLA